MWIESKRNSIEEIEAAEGEHNYREGWDDSVSQVLEWLGDSTFTLATNFTN